MLTKDIIIKINQGIITEWNEKNPANKETFQVAEDRLDEVLELVKKHDEPIAQACYLLAGIAWAQPFSGGNKRTAFISADTLLGIHGYRLQITTDNDIEYLRSLLFEIQEGQGELDDFTLAKIILYVAKRLKRV